KDAGLTAICDAVRAASTGGTVLPFQLHGRLAGEIRLHGEHGWPTLSAREVEVLGLSGEGLSARQIGERLFLSPATIKTHLQHSYEKLGVSGRAAAVAAAMRRGLIA